LWPSWYDDLGLVPIHEQSKSAVTDHAITVNHVIDWDQAKVDRENNKMDRWVKEAIHIRKEEDNSMNRD